jgi:hypothetical protein
MEHPTNTHQHGAIEEKYQPDAASAVARRFEDQSADIEVEEFLHNKKRQTTNSGFYR